MMAWSATVHGISKRVMLNFLEDSPAFIDVYRRNQDPKKLHDSAAIIEDRRAFLQSSRRILNQFV